ncbi:MAG: helix-turn-helix domain-containing protein [Christensenellales bacterium]|jgi:AraC family transcriptional regulator
MYAQSKERGIVVEHPFSYFLEAIPKDMYYRTKSHICSFVAIFEPDEYKLGEVICVDDYHFLLFFSESPAMTVAGREYKLKKGDLLVIRPWEEVFGYPSEKKYGKYINISIKKDFFERTAAQTAGGEPFSFKQMQGRYSAQLLDIVGNFQREIMDYGQAYPLMLESICTQLVFQLIRDLHSKAHASKAGKENQYIRAAIELMEKHYNSNISINDICRLIYLSPCHFKRVFKEHTGQSPYQYLMRIRIEKSKELLKSTDDSVEEVARRCGFVNSGHFATVFKRHFNLSPTEFRKVRQTSAQFDTF